jgi:hypothetical protein
MDETKERLARIGLPAEGMEEDLVVFTNESGSILRNAENEIEVALGVDAVTAYDYELLSEDDYRALITRFEDRLKAVDCEALNPTGKNLLLTMDPDGRFSRDEAGELEAVLCNFELIRGLYRPFR